MLTKAPRDLIIAAMTHPRNAPFLFEYGQDPTEYEPDPNMLYVAHGDQGFASAQRFGQHAWFVHIVMLPGAKDVTNFVRQTAKDFAFLMDARKFIGPVPEDCRAARIMNLRCGFHLEARIKSALQRTADKRVDMLLYGMEI